MIKKLLFVFIGIFLMSFVSSALTDDLISYYKLDETTGTNADDAHGSHDGTANNARVFTEDSSGIINTGAYFFTREDNIDLGNDASFHGTNITMCLWVNSNISDSSYFSPPLLKKDAWALGIRNGHMAFWNYGINSRWIEGSVNVIDGNWNYLCLVFSGGTTGQFYVNAETDGSSFGMAVNSQDYTFRIGGYTGEYLDDSIVDEFGFWNRTLSSLEITTLYNSGSGLAYPFGSSDTCSCPGLASNWEINMSDYCNITEDCNLSTGKLSFTGTGITRINATITTSDLGDPGVNGILRILINALVWII